MQTWVCSSSPFDKTVMGFGLTPALAYADWLRWINLWC